ncbi:MAG: hypothetical protein H6688_01445 [Erysipelotrichaceae bacterium]|nr:hypothetical protein [Erysipelotrichaceae bacterium]
MPSLAKKEHKTFLQSKATAIITDDIYSYDVVKISTSDVLDVKPHEHYDPLWDDEIIFVQAERLAMSN